MHSGRSDDYRLWLRASGTSKDTLRLRSHYLRRLSEFHAGRDLLDLELRDLVDFLARADWAPETRKSARATIRGFYQWALRTGQIDDDPSALLPPVRIPPGRPRPAPDSVFAKALLAAGPRDRLMLMLAAYAGLRRGEIARVHSDDVVGDSLRVHGKGGKIRAVPLHPQLLVALRAQSDGWVFPGRIDGHLSPGHVGKTLQQLLGPGWSGHTLRHRFASRAYAADRDLRAVQELLGHSKPETTARYTAVPDGALRAAVMAVA